MADSLFQELSLLPKIWRGRHLIGVPLTALRLNFSGVLTLKECLLLALDLARLKMNRLYCGLTTEVVCGSADFGGVAERPQPDCMDLDSLGCISEGQDA